MRKSLICGGAGGPHLLAGCGGGGAGASTATVSLIDAITAAGETANLQLCLDAADINSYSGSGALKDVSGNARDFTNTDALPFSGTPGGLSGSEYFEVTAAPMRLETAAGAWSDPLIQKAAKVTVLVAVYIPPGGSWTQLLWNYITGNSCEVHFYFTHMGTGSTGTEMGKIQALTSSGGCSGTSTYFESETPGCGWMVLAMSYDEATGGGFHFANGAYAQTLKKVSTTTINYAPPQDTFDPDYVFSNGASSDTKTIKFGGGENGVRVQTCAVWTGRRLSFTGLQAIYDGIKGRYGL